MIKHTKNKAIKQTIQHSLTQKQRFITTLDWDYVAPMALTGYSTVFTPGGGNNYALHFNYLLFSYMP